MTTPLSSITEPSRTLPVSASYDVVVVGGGIAGIAAALAAVRAGVSVCLLERYCALGGLATIGNVITYLPLCDGRGRQVIGGISEELLRVSIQDTKRHDAHAHFDVFPECWAPGGDPERRLHHRFQADFNPDAAILSYEELLVKAGVALWYDTRFAAVAREGGRIAHVIVENKSGRSAIACRAVVDASGDADVCAAAGERTESLDTNVASGWFYTLTNGGDFRLRYLSRKFSEDATRNGAEGPFYRGDVATDVTAQILDARQMLRDALARLREESPDDDIQPMHITTYPCFRMTRRLVGAESLRRSDVHRWRDDAVCLANDWRRAGPVWAVPFSTLVGVENDNLTVCGRCMSSDSTVWDATRVIPVCGVTGEAAGLACAMAIRGNGGSVNTLAPRDVADAMRERGNLLSPELVAEA